MFFVLRRVRGLSVNQAQKRVRWLFGFKARLRSGSNAVRATAHTRITARTSARFLGGFAAAIGWQKCRAQSKLAACNTLASPANLDTVVDRSNRSVASAGRIGKSAARLRAAGSSRQQRSSRRLLTIVAH